MYYIIDGSRERMKVAPQHARSKCIYNQFSNTLHAAATTTTATTTLAHVYVCVCVYTHNMPTSVVHAQTRSNLCMHVHIVVLACAHMRALLHPIQRARALDGFARHGIVWVCCLRA